MGINHPDYTVIEELGRGASGTVYLAVQNKLNRKVAVKVLTDSGTENGRRRFLREAQILAQLDHPHIVSVYQLAELKDQSGWVLAMAYVDGGTLRSRANQITLRQALTIVRQIAEALGYAHDSGYIHRDVKPDNILFQDDTAMLADFGIARLTESQTLMTQLGTQLGTPVYMSPEQVNGEPLDSRTDLYSLGIVLYELLCGTPPFKADSAIATSLQHLTREPPALPPALAGYQSFISQVLAKDKTNRPVSADAFLTGLATATKELQWPLDEPLTLLRKQTPARQRAIATPLPDNRTGLKTMLTAGVLVTLSTAGFLIYQSNERADDSGQIAVGSPGVSTTATDNGATPATAQIQTTLANDSPDTPAVTVPRETIGNETAQQAQKPDTAQEKLQALLAAANEQLRQGNWFTGETQAVRLFKDILKSNPDNTEAISALEQIIENTRSTIEQQITSKQWDKTNETLNTLQNNWPDFPGISDLVKRFNTAKQQEEQKKAQAEKRAQEQAATERIRLLIQKALAAEDADRLLLPDNDNALFYYRSILAENPRHEASRSGIDRILETVVQRLNRHIDNKNLLQADDLFHEFKKAFPDNPKTALIATSLDNQHLIVAQRIARQRQQETEAKKLAENTRQLQTDVDQWLTLPSQNAAAAYPQLMLRIESLLEQSPQNSTLMQLQAQSSAHYTEIESTLSAVEDDTTDDLFRMPGF